MKRIRGIFVVREIPGKIHEKIETPDYTGGLVGIPLLNMTRQLVFAAHAASTRRHHWKTPLVLYMSLDMYTLGDFRCAIT